MEKIKANHIAVARDAAAKAKAGTITYQQQDCQSFVENCVKATGGKMDYAGSNTMIRKACTWVGTVAEAKTLGKLVPGVLVFMVKHDGKEPAQYRNDGIGNASHVGLYCGGEGGVIIAHSPESTGHVTTDTLRNIWTHVGLAKEIDYSASGFVNIEIEVKNMAAQATVWAENGDPVKLRPIPGTEQDYIAKVPVGTVVSLLETGEASDGISWSKVTIPGGQIGYMMTRFLQVSSAEDSQNINDGETVMIALPRHIAQGLRYALEGKV